MNIKVLKLDVGMGSQDMDYLYICLLQVFLAAQNKGRKQEVPNLMFSEFQTITLILEDVVSVSYSPVTSYRCSLKARPTKLNCCWIISVFIFRMTSLS